MPTIKCDYCGKEFLRRKSKIGKANYCCKECYNLNKRTRIETFCDYCGKKIEKANFFYKNNKKNYCSYECRFKGQRQFNNIELFENHAEIIINSPKYGEKRVLIDLDDVEKCKQYKWAVRAQKNKIGTNFYVVASVPIDDKQNFKGTEIKIHRFITNCPDDMVIDHINHDTLDNRKQNLRVCTSKENSVNKKYFKNSTGYKNIYFHKATQKFRVCFQRNKKEIRLGSFKTLEEAIKTRNNYVLGLNDEIELKMIGIKSW